MTELIIVLRILHLCNIKRRNENIRTNKKCISLS